MKKIKFRGLLILLLAFVLIFALVGCNDKNDDNKNNGDSEKPVTQVNTITTGQYFSELWAKSKTIGNAEQITKNDDLALSADLSLKLMIRNSSTIKREVNLGIALQLVLDRTSKAVDATSQKEYLTGAKSAAKVKLYDPASKQNWLTAYYFVDDAKNIYIDFDGQSIVLPFDTGYNDTYAQEASDFINNKVLIANGNITIADILNAVISGTGTNWNLNTLINALIELFNFDLDKFLHPDPLPEGTTGFQLGPMLDQLLGLSAAMDNGVLDIEKVLKGQLIGAIFTPSQKITYTNDASRIDYSTKLNIASVKDFVTSAINGVDMSDTVKDILGLLMGSEITLSYSTKNNDIDGIKLGVISNIMFSEGDIRGCRPAIELSINDISIEKGDTAKREEYFGMTKDKYKTDVAIDLEASVNVKGISLDPSKGEAETPSLIVLDGTYTVGVKGKIDLATAVANNGTQAYAYIAKDGKPFLEASFKAGALAVTVDRTVKANSGESIVETLVEHFGKNVYDWVASKFTGTENFAKVFFTDFAGGNYTLSKSFIGAKWENIDIVKALQDFINQPKAQSSADTTTDTETETFDIMKLQPANVSDLIKNAFKLIAPTNSNLPLQVTKLSDLLGLMTYDGGELTVDRVINAIKEHDAQNMLESAQKLLVIKGADFSKKGLLETVFDSKASVTVDLGKGADLGINVTINSEASLGIDLSVNAAKFPQEGLKVIGESVVDGTEGWFFYAVAA